MRVGPLYHNLVGYIVVELWDSEIREKYRFPVGTVFFVEHSVGSDLGVARYAVTCRHVIEGVLRDGNDKVFVRINDMDGVAADYPTQPRDWVLSETSDVAVIRFELPPDRKFWAYPIERGSQGMTDGQDVFFVGMFCSAPGSVSVQAVVRTGTIARCVSSVPLCFQSDPDAAVECPVHLVEMRSWGGESGSPVFIYDSRFPPETQYAFDPGYGPGHELRPQLLGLLYGQFEIEKYVSKGKKHIGVAFHNSGIGIVVPIGAISNLLNAEEFVKDRATITVERLKLANRLT